MLEHARKYTFRFGDKKIVISKAAQDADIQPYAKARAYALYHKKYPTIRERFETIP